MTYDAYWVEGKEVLFKNFAGVSVKNTLMRQIGYAATTSSGHVLKLSNCELMPKDEPTFLLRARDELALPLIEEYLRHLRRIKATGYKIASVEEAIQLFKDFQKSFPDRLKVPGVTEGR